jgi:replication factor A1
MKIAELRPDSKKIVLDAKVTEKGEMRDVSTRFGSAKVCNCRIEDDSGAMTLVLWDDQIDGVEEGDVVKLQNPYVREWNGQLQLNLGKFGKLVVVKPSAF